MKILFMGGHELGKLTLEFLIRQDKNIVGVVMPDTDDEWYKGVDKVAKKNDISLYKENNINNDDFVAEVKKLDPDLITVVNFPQILKEEIINIPNKGCINTHASLLPKYRGRAPLNWAIINGEDKTGVTVHYIDENIDTGDIILQNKIRIDEQDYIEDILDKVKDIYPQIIFEAVELIEKNNVDPISQNSSKGSYYGKRTPQDGQIKWDKSVVDIYNLIRAVSKPYPGAYSYLKGSKVLIWKAEIIESNFNNYKQAKLGEIVKVEKGKCFVKVKNGILLLKDIEFETEKKEINVGDVFNYKEEG